MFWVFTTYRAQRFGHVRVKGRLHVCAGVRGRAQKEGNKKITFLQKAKPIFFCVQRIFLRQPNITYSDNISI